MLEIRYPDEASVLYDRIAAIDDLDRLQALRQAIKEAESVDELRQMVEALR